MKNIIIIALGAVLLIGIAVGATVFLIGGKSAPAEAEASAEAAEAQEGEEGAAAEAEAEANTDMKNVMYHDFHPSFVVNIQDGRKGRFLQVDVAVMVYSQGEIDALKAHMPAVRNDLITLFSSQFVTDLNNIEGKEALRQKALESIQNVMLKRVGKKTVQDVFFNKFVIQ